jgi:predicted nucleic acid-binding Zn ribbon protein
LRKREPASVGDILKSLVRKTNLGKKIEQARIWTEWADLAGPALAEHGRPHAVKDNTLIIEVDSTVWMNRYAYYKWDILKRINRLFKREIISDIYILLTPDAEPIQK